MAITLAYNGRSVEIKTFKRNAATPVEYRSDSVRTQLSQAGALIISGPAQPTLRRWPIEGVVTASGYIELENMWLDWETRRANRAEAEELLIALTDGTTPSQRTAQVVFGGSAGAPKFERFDDYGRRWSVRVIFEEVGERAGANP